VGLAKADSILLLAGMVKNSEYLKLILKPSLISLTKYSASLGSGCVARKAWKDDHAWDLRGEIINLPSHGSRVWRRGQHESNPINEEYRRPDNCN